MVKIGSDWSLIVAGNAAARDGYAAIPPVADTHKYEIHNTNFMKMGIGNVISYIAFRTGTVATYLRGRFRDVKWRNYAEAYMVLPQTSGLTGKMDFFSVFQPYKDDAVFEFQADNTNTSATDVGIAIIGEKPVIFTNHPDEDAIPVLATATQACVAHKWTDTLTVTWSFEFEPEAFYKIVGLAGHSATGYAMRLLYKGTIHSPGCLVGDTVALQKPVYTDFGTFKGANPPNLEWFASGTDGDVYATVWIKKVG